MYDSLPTLAEAFRVHGYATAAFMGNAGYGGRQTGFNRGFVRYDDFPISIEQLFWSTTCTQIEVVQNVVDAILDKELWRVRRIVTRNPEFRGVGFTRGDRFRAPEIADNFLAWRVGVEKRPYFVMRNLFDAHSPYRTPMKAKFGDPKSVLNRYDGAIAYEDSIIGSLLDRLRQRGDLDHTILAVVADHGEQFGEHGLKHHGNSVYRELLHVPLLIRAPGLVPAGERVGQVVSLRDVPATLLELAGIQQSTIPGVSLSHRWRGDPLASSPAIAETEHTINLPKSLPTWYGAMQALVGEELHYIRRGDGQERVYAWRGDTTGHGDQTKTPEGIRAIAESRRIIEAALGSPQSPSDHR